MKKLLAILLISGLVANTAQASWFSWVPVPSWDTVKATASSAKDAIANSSTYSTVSNFVSSHPTASKVAAGVGALGLAGALAYGTRSKPKVKIVKVNQTNKIQWTDLVKQCPKNQEELTKMATKDLANFVKACATAIKQDKASEIMVKGLLTQNNLTIEQLVEQLSTRPQPSSSSWSARRIVTTVGGVGLGLGVVGAVAAYSLGYLSGNNGEEASTDIAAATEETSKAIEAANSSDSSEAEEVKVPDFTSVH